MSRHAVPTALTGVVNVELQLVGDQSPASHAQPWKVLRAWNAYVHKFLRAQIPPEHHQTNKEKNVCTFLIFLFCLLLKPSPP